MQTQLQLWLPILVQAVPLATLAGAAVAFVWNALRGRKSARFDRLLHLMQLIDGPLPIATKLASVYALRQFTDHKQFVIRFCETQAVNLQGNNTQSLMEEMLATARFMHLGWWGRLTQRD